MKKKSVKLPHNKKKSFGKTFATYCMIFIEKLLPYDEMPSMVEAITKPCPCNIQRFITALKMTIFS